MGANRHNSGPGHPDPAWLDWLHLEADGSLPAELAGQLAALPVDEVQRARARLAAVTNHLRDLTRPEAPRSLAGQVAGEVAWSARLRASPLPPFTGSVAPAVVTDLRLDRHLTAPPLPRSVAHEVARAVTTAQTLQAPPLPRSVAASVAAGIALSRHLQGPVPPVASVAGAVTALIAADAEQPRTPTAPAPAGPLQGGAPRRLHSVPSLRRSNPAPLLLVLALLAGLMLLAVSTAWPNLAAGALVVQTLLAQVSPLAGVGLSLLLLTSLLITWRPTPALRQVGAAAFALSAVLTLPALYSVMGDGDIHFGQDVTVQGTVTGNVIAVGGNIHLQPDARVQGQVVTLLGDVRREAGAQVTGRVNALLGHAPGDLEALETQPPAGISLATAAAFRPVLGWLGGAAWPQVFVTLTGGALLLLFVAGLAPGLAQRQRHAPIRTLALGVLVLFALLGPALALALAGLLGPALLAAALAVLVVAVGLSVTVYDAGCSLATRVKLPVPDAVGALMGLSAVAASLSVPPLAFALALIGGAWGAGTLVLARGQLRT